MTPGTRGKLVLRQLENRLVIFKEAANVEKNLNAI